MNDLEIIEHWAIRSAILRFTIALTACSLGALACAVGGLFFQEMFIAAATLMIPVLLCLWRLGRLWKRLDQLEQFIP